MDFLYLTVVEATDLLQKLSLDSDAKTIDAPDAAKKVFSCFLLQAFYWRALDS